MLVERAPFPWGADSKAAAARAALTRIARSRNKRDADRDTAAAIEESLE